MNKKTQFITEIGIFSALAIALDLVCGLLFSFSWTQGGSISIGMFPVFIMAMRWGPKGGFSSGFIFGVIQIVLPTAFLAGGLFQVLFDYVFAFTVLGVAGFMIYFIKANDKHNIIVVSSVFMIIAGLLRSIFHIISGMLFFDVPLWGSIVYNMPYMLPSMAVSIIIVIAFTLKAPQLVFLPEEDLSK